MIRSDPAHRTNIILHRATLPTQIALLAVESDVADGLAALEFELCGAGEE
jgi:hypothetical protein